MKRIDKDKVAEQLTAKEVLDAVWDLLSEPSQRALFGHLMPDEEEEAEETKRFRVLLVQPTTRCVQVDVVAKNEEEAEDKALAMAYDFGLEWEISMEASGKPYVAEGETEELDEEEVRHGA